MPGYWMNETSGVLRPAIEALIFGSQLTPDQIETVRAYLAQWMDSPWGPEEIVQSLRNRISGLASNHDVHEWLDDAVAIGIDPL